MLETDAEVADLKKFGTVYRNSPPTCGPANLTALPYFLWNSRGQGS